MPNILVFGRFSNAIQKTGDSSKLKCPNFGYFRLITQQVPAKVDTCPLPFGRVIKIFFTYFKTIRYGHCRYLSNFDTIRYGKFDKNRGKPPEKGPFLTVLYHI